MSLVSNWLCCGCRKVAGDVADDLYETLRNLTKTAPQPYRNLQDPHPETSLPISTGDLRT